MKEENVIFGGRLAEYMYYDMAPTIESAMKAADRILTHQ
jgi:UDP-galactopyranose mutase